MTKITELNDEDLQDQNKVKEEEEKETDILLARLNYLETRQSMHNNQLKENKRLMKLITLVCCVGMIAVAISLNGKKIYNSLHSEKQEVVVENSLTSTFLADLQNYPTADVPFIKTKNILDADKTVTLTAPDIKDCLSQLSQEQLDEIFMNYGYMYADYNNEVITCNIAEDCINLYTIDDETGNLEFLTFIKYIDILKLIS